MRTCYQFENMTILQHGESVAEWYQDFLAPIQKFEWRMPEWAKDERIIEKLLPLDIMQMYQTMHDCGKPFCREVDSEGKQHFPNHAYCSYQRWLECAEDGPEARQIAELIRMDMLCHTLKSSSEIIEFSKCKEAPSLLITALCELHSNATLFGGIESVSFKIKAKSLDKIAKKVLNELT